MENNQNKYLQFLNELKRFQNKGEDINTEEFENWKEKIINELSGNYKIRFSKLEFYTVYEESNFLSSDDLPF